MRKPIRTRNGEQRERQRAYRQRLKQERRPGRDDIARILLHAVVTRSVALGRRDELEKTVDLIVDRLGEQGFDVHASYEAFDDLIEKYTRADWGFRRKVHLANGHMSDGEGG